MLPESVVLVLFLVTLWLRAVCTGKISERLVTSNWTFILFEDVSSPVRKASSVLTVSVGTGRFSICRIRLPAETDGWFMRTELTQGREPERDRGPIRI